MADTDTGRTPDSDSVRTWRDELKQAGKRFKDFHDDAEVAVRRYLDDEKGAETASVAAKRLSLFHSNVNTLRSNLFAQIPQAEADRRYFDPADDVARTAAEMVSRILNNDMNNPQDQGNESLKAGLQDKLIAGLGMVRFRYKMTEEDDPSITPESLAAQFPEGVPEDYEVPKIKKHEECEPVYTYWKDVLWGPCRVWGPDWMAFRAYMTKEEVTERFGEKIAMAIPYGREQVSGDGASPGLFSDYDDNKRVTPEAEIWEIWDKLKKKVLWVVLGYDKFLDQKDDIIEVPGFYPTPRPLISNTTSAKFLPRPDYAIHKGLYEEIDELETRMAYLTRACKAVGVYDAANTSVKRIMSEAVENELIPVENWAIFSERGGMKGAIDWMPIADIVNALQVCGQQQQMRIEQLYQVTGMSDIIRGQATKSATATEQKIKAQFASVRLQFMQDEFAEYVSDLMNIKVAIIRNVYDPQRIIELSNVMATPDAQFAQQAVELIKNTDQFNIRVVVKADSLMQKNLEAIKGERTELLQGIAQFIGMAQPMIQMSPESAPFLFQMLQFGVSTFDGASEMEGLFDQWVQSLQMMLEQKKSQPPPPTDEQIKVQGQLQIEQAKQQGTMQIEGQKMQAEQQNKQADFQLEVQKMQLEAQIEREKADAELVIEEKRFALEREKMAAEMQMAREKHAMEMEKLQASIVADERKAQISERSAMVQADIKADAARQQSANGGNGAA